MNLSDLTCPQAQGALSARRDGLLEDPTALERHLALCAGCRARAGALQALDPAWEALREAAPPPDLWARIEARREAPAGRCPARVRPPGVPLALRVAAGLVGFVAVAVAARALEGRDAGREDGLVHGPGELHRLLEPLRPRAAEAVARLDAPELRLLRTLGDGR
jgi:hypothetical protein